MKQLPLLLGIFLLVIAMGVSATTVTVTAPATNAKISGTYNFTATVAITGSDNISVCNFSTTADGVFGTTVLGNVSGYWNQSSTASLTDTASTTITVNCYNYSGNGGGLVATGTSTGVMIDNSNPTCSCLLEKDQIEKFDPMDYDCSGSTDAIGSLNYSCVATYDDSTTETETVERGYFEDTLSLGDVSVACTVTDELGNTNSCSALTSRIKGDGAGSGGFSASKSSESNNTAVIAIIGILLVVIITVTVIVLSMQTKKRRKK